MDILECSICIYCLKQVRVSQIAGRLSGGVICDACLKVVAEHERARRLAGLRTAPKLGNGHDRKSG